MRKKYDCDADVIFAAVVVDDNDDCDGACNDRGDYDINGTDDDDGHDHVDVSGNGDGDVDDER
jgi:hypothetical protein